METAKDQLEHSSMAMTKDYTPGTQGEAGQPHEMMFCGARPELRSKTGSRVGRFTRANFLISWCPEPESVSLIS